MGELLSVIIPIYNAGKYLERCLDSVISQTYENLQIICVDDGSTDLSGFIADEFAKRDSRIQVIHKKNEGIIKTRQCGIQLAKGKYTTNVDNDDWIESDMYQTMMALAIDNDADVVTSGVYRDYGTYIVEEREHAEKGLYEKTKLYTLKQNLVCTDTLFRNNITVHTWNKLYKTDKVKPYILNADARITIGDDIVISYPTILSADRVVVSGESFYHYCLRPDSTVGMHKKGDTRRIRAAVQYMDKMFEKFSATTPNIMLQANVLKSFIQLFRDLENHVKYEKGILYPFGEIRETEKLLIYGAGKFGKELYNFLHDQKWFSELQWADTDGKNGAKSVGEIDFDSVDKIIIAVLSADVSLQIKDFLITKGVHEEKLLTFSLL